MEVFSKYFRRLLQGNYAQIFPPAGRPAEPSSTYHLLVGEMQKLRHDPQQAEKIAESIDTTEGDLFRDFDLSGFLDHFKLDAISRFSLSLALKDASKPDLRSKGELTRSPTFALTSRLTLSFSRSHSLAILHAIPRISHSSKIRCRRFSLIPCAYHSEACSGTSTKLE